MGLSAGDGASAVATAAVATAAGAGLLVAPPVGRIHGAAVAARRREGRRGRLHQRRARRAADRVLAAARERGRPPLPTRLRGRASAGLGARLGDGREDGEADRPPAGRSVERHGLRQRERLEGVRLLVVASERRTRRAGEPAWPAAGGGRRQASGLLGLLEVGPVDGL